MLNVMKEDCPKDNGKTDTYKSDCGSQWKVPGSWEFIPGKTVSFLLREQRVWKCREEREHSLFWKEFIRTREMGRYVGEKEKKLAKYLGGRRKRSHLWRALCALLKGYVHLLLSWWWLLWNCSKRVWRNHLWEDHRDSPLKNGLEVNKT